MKRYWIVLLCCLPVVALADVSLQVTKGVHGALPIGVEHFVAQGSVKTGDLSSIIADDLENSGQFDVMRVDGKAPATDIFWQQEKVNAVLRGQVSAQGNNQYQVEYVLTAAYTNPSEKAQDNQAAFGVDSGTVLAEGQFLVSQADLRTTAHRISNQIYQKLLGEKGPFLSRLAFVSVKHLDGNRVQFQLMVSDYDGQNASIVYTSPEPILTPAWSPDGSSLVFVAYNLGRSAVYLDDLKNKSLRVLTQFPGVNIAPRFSADGKTVYMSLAREAGVNIYALNLASGALAAVTQGLSVKTSAVPLNAQSFYLTSTSGGSPQVYRCNSATQAFSRVSFDGDATMAPDYRAGTLVYLQRNGSDYQIMRFKGGESESVSAKGQIFPGTLSPNAHMMVYGRMINGQRRLVLTSLDSAHQVLLPALDGDLRYPVWSWS
ncbi:MAG: hypothetical protein COV52_01420 [Gammaproteobacteria bacterium CG11_big_fil_rev_8_21_14_0_20_46_22]|nr:MAG: hypothetical protein COW05_03145 [Gammaproteobacteria bacterium CG12_big_fil_rev_8_21_14_0_65_46_12]PIR11914.1 MAG: hypothetical protein COV52_01420 [Gammaproteobacteria bacterium CG11_big_fil_rev_8_21_14_0_20_46_22]